MLEGFSGVSGEGDIGVKREALQARTPRFLLIHDGRGRAQQAHGMTGARTAGDKLLDGGGGIAGQQGHLWFISGTMRVPFLLVFLGVLGGLATFGAIGLFVGPVTITLLLVLWREWTELEPPGIDTQGRSR